jgi:nucleotide-binding universal stress UspA family protein
MTVMIEIRRILCPIDFSDYSRRALDHAMAIARWYGSTVTALHVFSSTPVVASYPGPVVLEPIVLTAVGREELLAETKAFIDAEAVPGVRVEAVVQEGQAAAEIADMAISMNADLLVIGTHGRSGFERLLLGSVTEKVLRKARCPVLTVPRRLPDAVPAGAVLYKRILCPVDFSASSLHALKYATSLAQESDGQLTVLHVVSHEFENAVDKANAVAAEERMTIGDFRREREEALRRRLKDAVSRADTEYCTADGIVTHGKPWNEILRIASERQSDLIVMGVQGRGAADLMFFGSTTQHVVRDATCPVLTLRRS